MLNNKYVLVVIVIFLSVSRIRAQEAGTILSADELKKYKAHSDRNRIPKYYDIYGPTDNDRTKHGIADQNGKVIIPIKYPGDIFFSDGMYQQHNVIAGEAEGYYFYDMDGKLMNKQPYKAAYEFHNGYAIVATKDGKNSLINKNGKEVFSFSDGTNIRFYCEGYLSVSPLLLDQECYLIDTTGRVMMKNTETLKMSCEGLHEGLVIMTDIKTSKLGYADRTGKIVIPCMFDEARPFSEGLAAVSVNKKFGFVDKTGKIVIAPVYASVGDFSEGLAYVYTSSEARAKFGYVDKTGKLVIPVIYSGEGWNFERGFAEVESEDGQQIKIDRTGKVIK